MVWRNASNDGEECVRWCGWDGGVTKVLSEMTLNEKEGDATVQENKRKNNEFWALFCQVRRWDLFVVIGNMITWVTCGGITIHAWTEGCFSQIVGEVGELVQVDANTGTFQRIYYSRGENDQWKRQGERGGECSEKIGPRDVNNFMHALSRNNEVHSREDVQFGEVNEMVGLRNKGHSIHEVAIEKDGNDENEGNKMDQLLIG
ncbi:hypothetical protein Fmac_026142 [Flemingia macrophylla]|uniref:Uncharacterized protein n=1 Tax=Flemingia macrophylla TaxID=520843 RepID=A0ABD1LE25_9FABA